VRISNARHCKAGILGSLAALVLGGLAQAQVPDVIVYDIGYDGANTNDFEYYGQNSGIAAYSFGTQSCNRGTTPVDWFDAGGDTRHPVIAQNMFRLKDGRFEQLGQSWLKHGFCAVSETEAECAPCLPDSGCDELGVGCADTYWATLNDGGSGRSKRHVNATMGTHVESATGPAGNATIRGRLQVKVSDIDPAQNPGAIYMAEGQYITADDAQAGVSSNNCSWRLLTVNSVSNITGGGPTNRQIPAIFAWQEFDHQVVVKNVINPEAVGLKTLYYLAYRVTQVDADTWHYEYAIQNINSDQSASSFSVPVHANVPVQNIGFHDVEYHSGDPFNNTDWPGVEFGGEVRWASTETFNQNPNANALRWGTMYNFRFDADSPPTDGPVTMGLFKPGPQTSLTVQALIPTVLPHVPVDRKGTHSDPLAGSGGDVTVTLPMVADRPGSGVNPHVLSELSPAVVGGLWRGKVAFEGSTRTLLLVGRGAEGRLTRDGELLLSGPLSGRVVTGEPTLFIPDDPALVGTTFTVQAAGLTAEGWRLSNALDVTVGADR